MPTALMVGVPYDTFWELNLKTMRPFLKAYEMQVEAAHNRINLQSWVVGVYVQHAAAAMFGKGSNKYPTKPLDLFAKKKTPEEEAAEFFKFVQEHNRARKQAKAAGQTH